MNKSHVDALTGLPTYGVLISHLETLFNSVSPPEVVGILFIEFEDISHFNDAFGYNADKSILLDLIEHIRTLFSDAFFARIGTYSFVVVKETSTTEELISLSQNIINLLREPLSFQKNLLYVSAAIGIAHTENREEVSPLLLVKQAEYAMKEAKKQGINRIVVSRHKELLSTQDELRLLKELPYAIEREEIYFVYQGQFNYGISAFVRAEILARWEHPLLGMIPPSVFIPLAEKNGMITPLMTRTLIEAASMFEKLEAKGKHTFSLSINLPFQVLMEESFVYTLGFLSDAYNLAGRHLTFEIMEDTIPDHLESFSSRLTEIKSLGFKLAVDDYGTGHTSLTYLQYFPVDYIKIDRSFVANIHKEHKRFMLFKSIVDMADALELEVIAEGVETEEENEILLYYFDHLTVQGFLYSKPSKAENFLRILFS